jgi:hypothetical protein
LSYVYETYLNSSKAKQKAPATLRKQESMWRNHVSTYRHDEKDVPLGEMDINSIKITDLDNFLYARLVCV